MLSGWRVVGFNIDAYKRSSCDNMRDRRRVSQFMAVKTIIANFKGKITFKKVRAFLAKEEHPSPDRYAAMVISMVRGNTLDEDVCWH
jgi:hypothetical protein